MTPKDAYHKILRIIDYNTLNTVQGPGVSEHSVRQIAYPDLSRSQFKQSLQAAKENLDVFEYNDKLTLADTEHLVAIQEEEAKRDNPNKQLIGHINQLRDEI